MHMLMAQYFTTLELPVSGIFQRATWQP